MIHADTPAAALGRGSRVDNGDNMPRYTPCGLADQLARFMDTGRLPPDIINELCDEVQALQDQCASLIREREALRAEVTRLECGPWVQCGYCSHTVYVNASKVCPKCGTEVTYG